MLVDNTQHTGQFKVKGRRSRVVSKYTYTQTRNRPLSPTMKVSPSELYMTSSKTFLGFLDLKSSIFVFMVGVVTHCGRQTSLCDITTLSTNIIQKPEDYRTMLPDHIGISNYHYYYFRIR